MQSRDVTQQTTHSIVAVSGIRDQAFTPFAAQETFGAGIAHAAPENIADSYYDAESGEYISYKRRQSRIPLLNLLDHEGIVLNRHAGIVAVIGIASILQALLMGGFMGMFFAGLGGMSTILASLQLTNTPLMSILQETQKWIQFAEQQGIPVERIAAKMRGKMTSHFKPKRLANYALLTVLGRGAGSFWLGTVCVGLSAFALPDLLGKGASLLSGMMLFKKSFEDSATDIANYKMTHDPKILDQRVAIVVQQLMEIQAKKAEKKKDPWAQEKQAVKEVVQQKGQAIARQHAVHAISQLPPEQQHLADALMRVMARRMNTAADVHATRDQQVAQVAQAVLTRVPVATVSQAVLQEIKNSGVVPADVSKLLEVKAKMAALKVPDLANAPQNVQQAAKSLLSVQKGISLQGGFTAMQDVLSTPPLKMEIPAEMRAAMKGFATNAQEAFAR